MHPNDGRVVSNFIMQALRDEPITIYGNGNHTRSFCYVDDLVDGLIRLMNSPADFTGPVNLGNPGEFAIRKLAESVIELSGSRSSITHKPLPDDDPKRRCPQVDLARDRLGWEPKLSLSDGLPLTIEYFRALLREAPEPGLNNTREAAPHPEQAVTHWRPAVDGQSALG